MDYSVSKTIYGFTSSPMITNTRNIFSSVPSKDFVNPGHLVQSTLKNSHFLFFVSSRIPFVFLVNTENQTLDVSCIVYQVFACSAISPGYALCFFVKI